MPSTSPAAMAFATCLFTVFVDIMGQQFLAPVLVPYAEYLEASLDETGLLLTAEFCALLASQFVMSWLADTRGRRLVVCISMAGSAVAYLVQGLAPLGCGTGKLYWNAPNDPAAASAADPATCERGWEVLLVGKILAGTFGGTFATVLAYVAELSMPDMELLKRRQTHVFSVRTVVPIALGGIGGAIATFGLFIPFLVSSATALCGLFVALRFMREAPEIRALTAARRARRLKKDDDIDGDGGGGGDGGDGRIL